MARTKGEAVDDAFVTAPTAYMDDVAHAVALFRSQTRDGSSVLGERRAAAQIATMSSPCRRIGPGGC
jgi:hypothetical protein